MSKRILSLVAVMMLVMTMFAMTTTASAIYTAYSNCSNGQPLNVRSGPGKEYPVIGTIKYRDQIAVDHDLGNGWSELVWGSIPGYAMTGLMSRTDPGPYNPSRKQQTVTTTNSLNTIFSKARIVSPYTITTKTVRASGSANLRWAPSKTSTLLRAYPAGQELRVIAELGNDWYQVEDPLTGIVGFLNKAYVRQ